MFFYQWRIYCGSDIAALNMQFLSVLVLFACRVLFMRRLLLWHLCLLHVCARFTFHTTSDILIIKVKLVIVLVSFQIIFILVSYS